jgi:hypothetical protein
MRNQIISKFSTAGVKKRAFAFGVAVCTLGLGLSGNAQHLTTFDAPGAGTGPYQGTTASGINQRGEISGSYFDANYHYHGFLRSPDGKFTTFDVPGATAGFGTSPIGLNAEGATVGFWNDVNDKFHAFLRKPDGTIVSFTDPNACTGADLQGCQGQGFYEINAAGEIVGAYWDTNYVAHGLVISPDGNVTSFEAPGAGDTPDSTPTNYTFQGTETTISAGINQPGAITGNYIDSSFVSHGFLRSPGGTFADFDAPGADTTTAGYGTFPYGISDSGAITGDYLDANSVYHGFLRGPGGNFATFEAPGADTTEGSFNGTYPASINDRREITGDYRDPNDVYHGFVRTPDGTFKTFEAPGADATPGSFNGTYPSSINGAGVITGSYQDSNNTYHGFIVTP